MRKTITSLILMIIPLLMLGCASPPAKVQDGYHFGDITQFNVEQLAKIESARQNYCSKTATSLAKQMAIVALQAQLPGYPPDGICTDAMAALVNAGYAQRLNQSAGYKPTSKARESP